ncbi:hypothetical protein ACTXG6_15950 [Pseudonocardia sp. Cha107L01]|uniref:hypothetical protein n=1 Tax=Pseudonocardia sp. Cha107L01 TaxID=3457576 RepID=UPI00403E601C
MLLPTMLPAHNQPVPMPPDLSSTLMMPVYTSAIIVFGMLAALVIALWRTAA